jgi:glycosyltransferase involved in cell wall biosynthesis
MVKQLKKISKNLVKIIDYILFVTLLPFSFLVLLFSIPWVLKQRRIWQETVKGNPKTLFVQTMNPEISMKIGFEYLLRFRNPCFKWVGFFDPAHTQNANIKIASDVHILLRKLPKLSTVISKNGFGATAIMIREIVAVFRITSLCIEKKIGVLRAYKHDYAALRAYIVSRFIKIPYIVDIIGHFELIRRVGGSRYYFKKLRKMPLIGIFATPLTNWLLGLPLRHAFCVLGRNKGLYEHAFALGAPVERLSFIRYSNFDSLFSSYNLDNPPPKPAEYPYILFVGRLVGLNYPLDVIDAFDIAAQHIPEYRLVIIGDGKLRPAMEQRIERSDYKSRIVLTGACSSDIVFNWTAHAKIDICPCSGASLQEAMLCGVPIIAYDYEWHPEVIIDDYTGYLVPFRNIEALAEKIVYVLRNYEEAKEVSMRGRELARGFFDKDKIQEKETMIYKKALAK